MEVFVLLGKAEISLGRSVGRSVGRALAWLHQFWASHSRSLSLSLSLSPLFLSAGGEKERWSRSGMNRLQPAEDREMSGRVICRPRPLVRSGLLSTPRYYVNQVSLAMPHFRGERDWLGYKVRLHNM